MTPTSRSIKLYKDRGYIVGIVESYNSFTHKRKDLFNFADMVAVRPGQPGTTYIQTTSGSNVSSRVSKLISDPEVSKRVRSVLLSFNTVHINGWRKLKKKVNRKSWQVKILSIEIDGPDLTVEEISEDV